LQTQNQQDCNLLPGLAAVDVDNLSTDETSKTWLVEEKIRVCDIPHHCQTVEERGEYGQLQRELSKLQFFCQIQQDGNLGSTLLA